MPAPPEQSDPAIVSAECIVRVLLQLLELIESSVGQRESEISAFQPRTNMAVMRRPHRSDQRDIDATMSDLKLDSPVLQFSQLDSPKPNACTAIFHGASLAQRLACSHEGSVLCNIFRQRTDDLLAHSDSLCYVCVFLLVLLSCESWPSSSDLCRWPPSHCWH